MTVVDRFACAAATLGPIGRLKPAPGTWGSAVAALVGFVILDVAGPAALAVCAIAISVFGVWASERHQSVTGRKDASEVVIDEAAGQWIALVAAPPTALGALAAFGLFRLFDIWKPGPIAWADRRLAGGWGVMADDWLAGIAAALLLAAFTRLI